MMTIDPHVLDVMSRGVGSLSSQSTVEAMACGQQRHSHGGIAAPWPEDGTRGGAYAGLRRRRSSWRRSSRFSSRKATPPRRSASVAFMRQSIVSSRRSQAFWSRRTSVSRSRLRTERSPAGAPRRAAGPEVGRGVLAPAHPVRSVATVAGRWPFDAADGPVVPGRGTSEAEEVRGVVSRDMRPTVDASLHSLWRVSPAFRRVVAHAG